jgi:hypothetical protein
VRSLAGVRAANARGFVSRHVNFGKVWHIPSPGISLKNLILKELGGMLAEECAARRFTGFRVILRRLTALSRTTHEAGQRANMGNGRIAALARQYNTVVVIIRPLPDVPLWGQALGVRISRLASLRRART